MINKLAHIALRRILADGWESDDMARKEAIRRLVLCGHNEETSARAVDAAMTHFKVMGA